MIVRYIGEDTAGLRAGGLYLAHTLEDTDQMIGVKDLSGEWYAYPRDLFDALEIEELDVILLKDGRKATIVEKFSETDFLVDAGRSPEDWDTISATLEDIEKMIWKYKKAGE